MNKEALYMIQVSVNGKHFIALVNGVTSEHAADLARASGRYESVEPLPCNGYQRVEGVDITIYEEAKG